MNNYKEDKLEKLKEDAKSSIQKLAQSAEVLYEDIKDYHHHNGGDFSKDLAVCGLSALTITFPFYSFFETDLTKLIHMGPGLLKFFPDLNSHESLILRLFVLPAVVVGGYVGDKIRIRSRKKIKEESMGHHDGKFGSKAGFGTNIIPYGIKFWGEWANAAIMTLGSLPISYTLGRIEGFVTDFMKHSILNETPTERIPDYIKNLSRKSKLALAGLMVASSSFATYENYNLSDYLSKISSQKIKTEIKINSLEKNLLNKKYSEFKKWEMRNSSVTNDGTRVYKTKNYLTSENFYKK